MNRDIYHAGCDLLTLPLLLWGLQFILVFKLKFVLQGYKIIN